MALLLVSVRSAAEARLAVQAGADIVDVKEPRLGSLGAASAAVWEEVAAVVGSSAQLSLAAGELLEQSNPPQLNPPQPSPQYSLPAGYRFAKLGLAGTAFDSEWQMRLIKTWQNWQTQLQPVAVVYADWQAAAAPPPSAVAWLAHEQGVQSVLVDTWDKKQGRLVDYAEDFLPELARDCQELQLRLVLAGSLRLEDLPRLAVYQPWAVAIRGAACLTHRNGELAGELVQLWATQLASWRREN